MTTAAMDEEPTLEGLLETDPPRGMRWLMAVGCTFYEKALAGGVKRADAREERLRDVWAYHEFAHLTRAEVLMWFESEWIAFNKGGGMAGFIERERVLMVSEKREADLRNAVARKLSRTPKGGRTGRVMELPF